MDRSFLRAAVSVFTIGATAALLAACGSKPAPSPSPSPEEVTLAPARPADGATGSSIR